MHPDQIAVRARTSVDCARTGVLTTYARHPSSQATTHVVVGPRADGTVELRLPRTSAGARQLVARPVATLRVAPAAQDPVLLHGSARRLPGIAHDGALVFHLRAAAVRVGARGALLDEQAYAAAEPDPLRHDAPAVLAHLNGGHADALAACLRARGHDAGFAQAVRLDAGGLTVLAVGVDGVDRVRLRFPAPVHALSDLPVSLGGVLSPRCGCSASRPVEGAG